MPRATRLSDSAEDPKPLSEVLGDHVEFDPQDTLVLSGESMPPVIEDSDDPDQDESVTDTVNRLYRQKPQASDVTFDEEGEVNSNFYKPELTLDLAGLTVIIAPPTVADIKRAEERAPNSEVESNYELVAACCLQWGNEPAPPPFERVKAKHLSAIGREMLKIADVWMQDAEAKGFEVIDLPNGDVQHKIVLRDGKVAVFREPFGPDLKLMEGRSLPNKKVTQVASALCIKWGERKGVAIPQLDKIPAWDFYLIQNAIQSFLI